MKKTYNYPNYCIAKINDFKAKKQEDWTSNVLKEK